MITEAMEDLLIDLVYDLSYQLKIQEKFEYMNELLGLVKPNGIPLSVILSYLTITFTVKDKLPNRKRLYDYAFQCRPQACHGLE